MPGTRAASIARIARFGDRTLPFWFLLWSAIRVYQLSLDGRVWDTTFLGRDFRIYRDGALALISGGDPWAAADRWNGTDWHFAALPTAAQLFVPFAWIPEGFGMAIFFVVSAAVAWCALRRVGLPTWWLLFPPLTEGLVAANPQIVLFGLLLLGGPVARAIAAGLKIYAVVPMVARKEGRAVLATVGLLVASVTLGAGLWSSYASQFGAISARIAQESQGGVSATMLLNPKLFGASVPPDGLVRFLPGILLYGLAGLLVLGASMKDVRAAGWMAVPLLWPAAEYHLASMAIPAARRLSTWVIAIATPPTYLLGLILLAYEISAGRQALTNEPAPVGLVSWLRTLSLPGHRTAPAVASGPESGDTPLPRAS